MQYNTVAIAENLFFLAHGSSYYKNYIISIQKSFEKIKCIYQMSQKIDNHNLEKLHKYW